MTKVAVTYSAQVGGSSVISLKSSLADVGFAVNDADYREMMSDISAEEFNQAYQTLDGRQKLFAHAKAQAERLLSQMDCLALSGNIAMIDPALFNQERLEDTTYDFSRTLVELALVHVATQKGMPIIGICGGHQVIAVYSGGTIKNLDAPGLQTQRFMTYDAIKVRAQSMLAQIFAPENSPVAVERSFFGAHNQVVDVPGKGLEIVAVASDGESIEALENRSGAPVISTQFHPEVNMHGLPHARLVYEQDSQEDYEAGVNFFKVFRQAADAHNLKKQLLTEFKEQFTEAGHSRYVLSQLKDSVKAKPEKKPKIAIPMRKSSRIALAIFTTCMVTSTVLFFLFPPAGLAAFLLSVGIPALAITAKLAIGCVIGAMGSATVMTIFSKALHAVRERIANFMINERVAKMQTSKVAPAPAATVPTKEVCPVNPAKVEGISPSPAALLSNTHATLWHEQKNVESAQEKCKRQEKICYTGHSSRLR